jgi:hypothetical protein
MSTSQAILLSAIFGLWLASPAKSADPNSASDANRPAREMKLDEFLYRFRGLAGDYKEANVPAKKEELLGKIRKAIEAEANDLVLTMSGQVADIKVQKDGSVKVGLSVVEEVKKLRGKPLEGLFRTGAADWAEGGTLRLKMTPEQAAGITKGDKWVFRGRAFFQADADSVEAGINIQVYIVSLVRVVRFTSEKNVTVGAIAFPKYSCTIGGAAYESAGAG